MKTLFLGLIFILTCTAVIAQIQIKQIGKVHYVIIPSNKSVSQRNDSIAKTMNDYIQQHAVEDFPNVLLYINDQNSESKLSNFEQFLVYYQKYRGEFFNKYNNVYSYNKEHIGIDLSLFRNHYQKGMEAIKYAVSNLKKLKKEEKRLSKKNKRDMLTNADLKSFEL
jgi:mevalonate pyrophosphate decarboxylase